MEKITNGYNKLEREARHVEPSSDGDPMHDHWP
jgi:hypothetical protein